MIFSIKLPQKEHFVVFLLLIIYVLSRLPLLNYLPLIKDEAIYSVMSTEQMGHLTLIPTFLGYPVSWKPAPFFWLYGFFSNFPLPIEMAFRLPSFIFGFLTLIPLYLLLRNIGLNKNIAFFSIVIFLFSLTSIYSNLSVLTDSMLFFFICLSLYFYTEKRFDDRRFIAAAIFAFAAFFSKFLLALFIPLMALVYFYLNDKKTLQKPLFLLSLLAVPIAFLIQSFLLTQAGLGGDVKIAALGYLAEGTGLTDVSKYASSLYALLPSLGMWFVLSFLGLINNWKNNLFMTFWYGLSIFPFLFGYTMVWYYLPVMPAIGYFAALALIKFEGVEKLDLFFVIVFSLILISTLYLTLSLYSEAHAIYSPEREAGLFLSGKKNVGIFGLYAPGVFSYKILDERRSLGHSLDFGWVMLRDNFSLKEENDFINDYHRGDYPIINGSFEHMFTSPDARFRKDTNLSKFEYIAVFGFNDLKLPNATVVYNRSLIQVYKVD
ncbi:glycosyltransferase family 39 protein [Candidatus Micrarchaeota archaeon]|nr:glycosyltransferase family 39 protein [Candidatus Micrarchaeota archaeon]